MDIIALTPGISTTTPSASSNTLTVLLPWHSSTSAAPVAPIPPPWLVRRDNAPLTWKDLVCRKTPNRHGANEQSNSETNSEKFIHDWKAELAATMTASNYARWVAPLEVLELVNNHAVLSAPDAGTADYARTRLADTLTRALNVERIEVRAAK